MSKAISLGVWMPAAVAKRPAVRKTRKAFRAPSLQKVNMMLLVASVLFGVGYLVVINSLATKGYHISELEAQISELQHETRQLELQAIELRSLDTVQARLGETTMVPIEGTEFINPAPVAINR